MRGRSAILLMLLLMSVSLAQAQAPAPRRVSGDVLIVLAADSGPRQVDPRLANVPALRQPPFNQYPSLTLLSSPRIELRVGQPSEVALPNGRTVRIVLREVTEDGRYRLQVSINRRGEQDYLPELNVVVSPGDPFFVAGQQYGEGTLVIGFRLGQRARR